MIVDPDNQKLVSIASIWEIAIKVAVGKIQLGEPARTFLPREITRNNFDLLPISLEHAAAVESLPMHHRDPFDRLLIAQAMIEQVEIVSIDPAFDSYPVRRKW